MTDDPIQALKTVLPALVEKLLIYERFQQSLQAHQHLAVIEADADGTIEKWNPGAEKLFGWRRAEAVGKLVADLIVPERYREAHRNGLARLRHGEAMHGYVLTPTIVPALHRGGYELETRGLIVPLIDVRHGLLGSIGLFENAANPPRHLDEILAEVTAHG